MKYTYAIENGWCPIRWKCEKGYVAPDDVALVTPDPSLIEPKVRRVLTKHKYNCAWRVTNLKVCDCLLMCFLSDPDRDTDLAAAVLGVVISNCGDGLTVEFGLSEEDCCRYIDELRIGIAKGYGVLPHNLFGTNPPEG